jgi:23S rRNA pseudouridine2605 synthase
MAYEKSKFSERPKRDSRSTGQGDKKSFISKFKRKDVPASGAEKPTATQKESKDFGPPKGPRKRIGSPAADEKKSFVRRPSPGSFMRNEKPGYRKSTEERSPSSFRKNRPDKGDGDKRSSFSKGAKRDFDKPFEKRDGKSFGKPFGANRAFSAEKKYFKRKPDSEGREGGETKRPMDKIRSAPNRGRAKSFGPPRLAKPRKFSARSKREEVEVKPKDGLIRLNKFISNSGVCSRREADELIKMGLISVNGKVITEMGHKVKPTDDVRHDGTKLHAEKPVYVLLNKPKGFITTTDDPQERKTVMGLIGGAVKERIYPVGRLDRNTTGLLLLTNDGDLADKLTHPSYNAKKIYKVELDKPLTKPDFEKIVNGVHLEEGKAIVDDLAYVDDDKRNVGIELHIGWNRVVRRIFESLGYEVVKLDRVVYAGLDKKNLGRGEWRYLSPEEVVKMKHLNKG